MGKKPNSKFNKSVDLLLSNLTHIKFGYSFNQHVDNLPFLMEWLEFGYSFNQPVNDLPNTLEYVSFGKKFNQSFDSLPNSIFYINIGSAEHDYYNGDYHFTEFNQKTYNLPSNLENILIYLKNKKYPIKNDFVLKINKLIGI